MKLGWGGIRGPHDRLYADVRYPSEIWQLEVPLRGRRFDSEGDVELMRQDFHNLHCEVFGTSDPASPVVAIGWRGRGTCR